MTPAQPVRILHIITRLDLGGSAENTLLTSLLIDKRRFAVDICCGESDNPPSPTETRAVADGVSIIRMKRLVRRISPVDDLIALWQLWRLIRSRGYDIVHTHTSKAGIVGRIAARLAGTPRIIHTPHGHVFYGYFSHTLTRVFVLLERAAMGFTHAMITLTEREKQDYLARGIGPAQRIHVVHSGVSLEPFLESGVHRARIRTEWGVADSEFVVGTVARLVDIKNHAMIVSAAAHLRDTVPGARYVFVGDGELRTALEHQVQEAGLTARFIFTGWRSDIPAALSAFDIFVMCSKNEGMGRAFVEAQAAGAPVIGTDVGGVAEVLRDGHTGFLARPDDAADLADKIHRLYTLRDAFPAIGAAARAWAIEGFGDKAMVARIAELYEAK